jgi:hypothetical protein
MANGSLTCVETGSLEVRPVGDPMRICTSARQGAVKKTIATRHAATALKKHRQMAGKGMEDLRGTVFQMA